MGETILLVKAELTIFSTLVANKVAKEVNIRLCVLARDRMRVKSDC